MPTLSCQIDIVLAHTPAFEHAHPPGYGADESAHRAKLVVYYIIIACLAVAQVAY